MTDSANILLLVSDPLDAVISILLNLKTEALIIPVSEFLQVESKFSLVINFIGGIGGKSCRTTLK